MRRPLLIVFIVLLFLTFLYTNLKYDYVSLHDNKNVVIEGVVKDIIEKEKYNQYKIDNFLVNDYSRKKNLKIGQVVKVTGKYKDLENMDFKDFNYGRFVKSTGNKALIYMSKYEVMGSDNIYTYIGKFKSYMRDTFRYLYKDKSDFINSIILGKKEYLSSEEKDMFSRSGISHIIAISGLHTGILCSSIAFITKGINKPYKLLILSIIMFLYSIMVGSSPSIIRSILFTVTLYLSVFLDKKRDGISTLSIVGIIFIVNNPYIIYNISFQLSFLATLSIIYFYGYINDIFKISLISLTISSNMLTLPIIYYQFKGIPILSIICNMIIIPFISIIIYCSIVSVIIFRINLWAAKSIAYFNKYIIDSIYYLLYKISDLDFAYIEIDNPKLYYVIIYYTVLISYMIYKELKIMKEQENELQGYYKKC